MSDNRCESETLGDLVRVRVGGEVDLSWSQDLRKAILKALGGASTVAVDMAEVSYIDSSGIAALVEGFQTARRSSKGFGLVAVSPAVLAVLELARLDKVFPIYPDLEALRAA